MKNLGGWLVVVLSFFIYFVCDGLTFSFGLIFVDILHFFGRSTSRTSVIASYVNCMPLLYSPIVCKLISRFGFRSCTMTAGLMISCAFCCSFFIKSFHLLQFVYGFVLTFGFSVGYLCAYIILPYWFDRNIAMAAGITVSGSGIGQASFSFLINYMLEYYGWQGTALILGGISLNISVLGYLYRVPKQLPISERTHKKVNTVDNKGALADIAQVLRIKQAWLFFIVNFMLMLAFSTPYVFLADHIHLHGIPLNPAVPYVLMGLSTTLGQLALGWVANQKLVADWVLYSATMLTAALSCCLLLIWPDSPLICVVHAVAYALAVSPSYVLMTTLLLDCVSAKYFDISLALTQVCQGLASLAGLPICGHLKDITGDYWWSYTFSTISLAAAALLMVLWPLLRRDRKGDVREDHGQRTRMIPSNEQGS